MDLRNEIEAAAREAGKIILNASDIMKTISEKDSEKNLVTEYDKQVQEFLETRLLEVLPEARFLGEENHEDLFREEYGSGWLFVIDPIDGTSNFIFGYRPSVTSIGLFKDGKPYAGVVYNPYSDIMISAVKGSGAFQNGVPVRSASLPLSRSLVSIGTAPYYEEQEIRKAFDLGFSYMLRCVDVRRSGSAAWDICQVACGVTGLFLEPVLQIWDYAAAAVILEEAGGRITDFSGNPLSYRGPSEIIAASAGVAAEDYLPPLPLTDSDQERAAVAQILEE